MSAWKSRLLLITASVCASLAGCTQFQQLTTAQWLESPWGVQAPTEFLVFWNENLHVTQDMVNGNVPLHVLAGKAMFFAEGSTKALEAKGEIRVRMTDVTKVESGVSPTVLAEWNFPPEILKRLRKKDGMAEGYTLMLPWEKYRPDVRKVQMQVIYQPTDGAPPLYAEPTVLTLNTANRPAPLIAHKNDSRALTPIANQN